MKKYFNFIFPVCIPVLLFACNYGGKKDLTNAEWVLGTWKNNTQKAIIYESWKKETDQKYSGKSIMVMGKDTNELERIVIQQEEGESFYIPIVKNQNKGLPVRFKATTLSRDLLVFENPKHDFPQTISYTRIHEDSIVAEISGTINGKVEKETYPMKRVK